jgi:hypothetical protein
MDDHIDVVQYQPPAIRITGFPVAAYLLIFQIPLHGLEERLDMRRAGP